MSPRYKEKAGVYFFFSRLFKEPVDKDFLKTIVEKRLLTEAYHFSKEDRPKAIFNFEKDEWLEMIETIAVEYTTLFVLSGEKSVLPYESFYCDTILIDVSTADSKYFCSSPLRLGDGNKVKGLISGPSAVSVGQSYTQEGYYLNPYYLPDHIACELEFIGRLYDQEKVSLAKAFLEDHLNRWIFLFLEKLRNQMESDFYRAVAVSFEEFEELERVESMEIAY